MAGYLRTPVQLYAKLLRDKVHRLAERQEAVPLAAARTTVVGDHQQTAGGHQVAELPFSLCQWRGAGDETDKNARPNRRAAVAVRTAKSAGDFFCPLARLGKLFGFLFRLSAFTIVSSEKYCRDEKMMLRSVHFNERRVHQFDRQRKRVSGLAGKALLEDEAIRGLAVAGVADIMTVGTAHISAEGLAAELAGESFRLREVNQLRPAEKTASFMFHGSRSTFELGKKDAGNRMRGASCRLHI
jgi:hypothetical protein